MSTLQIKFESAEQWQKVLMLLQALHLEFKVVELDIFAGESRVHDVHESYKAALAVLGDDWNDPENDHWDNC